MDEAGVEAGIRRRVREARAAEPLFTQEELDYLQGVAGAWLMTPRELVKAAMTEWFQAHAQVKAVER